MTTLTALHLSIRKMTCTPPFTSVKLFLFSCLSSSYANASFDVLHHVLLGGLLQFCCDVGPTALVVLSIIDSVAPWAPQSGTVGFDVLLDDAFSSELAHPHMALVPGGTESALTSGLPTVHRPSASHHGFPITLRLTALSHWSVRSNRLTARVLNTPSGVPTKHSALLLHTPIHMPNLYLGFTRFSGWNWSCHAISQVVSVLLAPSDTRIESFLRVPQAKAALVSRL